jgi:nitrite reductase/ring-hydroxylating ferredoxin subunit
VTLLKHKGKLYCIDSTCYHTGGPLGVGEIEEVAGKTCIKCPWHSYQVTLDEGGKLYESLVMGPDKKLVSGGWKMKTQAQRVHAVERRADGVYIRLHTEGKWDSDLYCTTAMKTPSETLSSSVDSSGPGSGSSSLHSSLSSVTGMKVSQKGASALGQTNETPFKASFDRPQRSGHVLNPVQQQAHASSALSTSSPTSQPLASQPLPSQPLP